MPKPPLTTIEEAKFRMRCVCKRVPDGWGDANSLRKFAHCRLVPRIDELQPLVDEWESWGQDHAEKNDLDITVLVDEHATLCGLLIRINNQVELDPAPMPRCWESLCAASA